jgi:hypothetical protein
MKKVITSSETRETEREKNTKIEMRPDCDNMA